MEVVNLSVARTCTHYCGRISSYDAARHGHFMDLGNPFRMVSNGSGRERELVIERFEAWARATPGVLGRIRDLPKDAVLGCWCKPAACHCDVIVKIWKELHP